MVDAFDYIASTRLNCFLSLAIKPCKQICSGNFFGKSSSGKKCCLLLWAADDAACCFGLFGPFALRLLHPYSPRFKHLIYVFFCAPYSLIFCSSCCFTCSLTRPTTHQHNMHPDTQTRKPIGAIILRT